MSKATIHYKQHAISIKLCSEKIEECDEFYRDLIKAGVFQMAERVLNIKKEWLDILIYHTIEINKIVVERLAVTPAVSTPLENKSDPIENAVSEDHDLAVMNLIS